MGTDQETVEKATDVNKSDSMRQEYTFAADVKLKECKYCCVMIPKKAKICPNCKMALRKNTWRRAMAAVLVIAVIGAGGYGLSAYLGWLPDSAVPVWMTRQKPSEAVLAVTTVETAETASGAEIAEPVDVKLAVNLQQPEPEPEEEPQETIIQSANATPAKQPYAGSGSAAGINDAGKEDAASELVKAVKDTGNTAAEDGESDGKEAAKEDGKPTTGNETSEDDGTAQSDKALTADENSSETADHDEDKTFAEETDENEAAFRADCVRRGYKELLRNQDYLSTAVWLEAEVVCQVDGGLFDENIYYLCMEEESGGIERYYIIRDDRAADQTLILEGDMITVYGRLFGNCKLPASLIDTRPTVPAISMLSCDLAEE